MNPDSYQPKHSHQPRALKWTLIIAIVIILNLFFNYAITLVYPPPNIDAFCPSSQIESPPTTQPTCLAIGGQWTQTVSPQAVKNQPATQLSGICDPTFTCQKNFDSAQTAHGRNVFIVLIVLGVLSLIAGIFTRASTVIAAGLSIGGVLSLIIAAIRYWSEAANIFKVFILAAALIALLWLGLKKFRN